MKDKLTTLIHDNVINDLRILCYNKDLTQTDLKEISGLLYKRLKQQEIANESTEESE